jgi:hypothetical protein
MEMNIDKNELIYLNVCRLHFRNEASITDIILIIGSKALLSYKHHTNDGVQTFTNVEHAITAIINCELAAQNMAKKFEFDYEYQQEQLNQKYAS